MNKALQERTIGLAKGGLAALFVLSLFVLSPYVIFHRQTFVPAPSLFQCHSSSPRASCVQLEPDQDEMVTIVSRLAKPEEPVFVANDRHDRVFIGDSGMYFLLGRDPPTRYHELHPGVVTTDRVQREIVGDLERQVVRWVVRWNASENHGLEPNDSAISSGVTVLDDYLDQTYTPVHLAGSYSLWRRLSGP